MKKSGVASQGHEHLDLAAFREHKGISLRHIADTTKISMRFLKAIEEGDFEQLPGGIYSSSYIRQYAREIGFEEGKLLAHYHSLVGTGS
ncbi:MAG: helix-turn-helix transcriptional regulator [Bryobacteraceae bacterium]